MKTKTAVIFYNKCDNLNLCLKILFTIYAHDYDDGHFNNSHEVINDCCYRICIIFKTM